MKLNIGFSKSRAKFPIMSWLIRLVESTEYSHVFVRWYSTGADADIVYEASGAQVHFKAGAIFDSKAETVEMYETEIDRETYKKLLHYCMTNAGVDYGMKQILGMGLVKLLGLKKNPLSDGRKSQVCSELAGNLLESIDVADLDLEVAGPKELNEFIRKSPAFRKVI